MIRTFIIDDHQLFIDGLKALLGLVDTIEVVGEALSGEEGIKSLRTTAADVLITDYSMGGMSGFEVVKYVREHFPDIRILTLSMHEDIQYIDRMTNAGSLGYILKNTGRKELVEAIESVFAGKTYYSVRVKESILRKYTKDLNPKPIEKKNTDEIVNFTRREKQVLKLLVAGIPSKEIADILCMSFHTVNTHRKNINSKISDVSDLTVNQYVKKYNIFDE
jgi:DNA-binding NarL/FixJ family response regulator